MRLGQVRALDLRLMEIRGRDRVPTDLFLGMKITCVALRRLYFLDVKADFGTTVPPVARLTVLRSRHEATAPVGLVEGDVPVEKGLLLEVDDLTEHVVFWVSTEGAAGVPERMAASIQVCPPPGTEDRDDLDTMRLPTVRQAAKGELAGALRRSHSPMLSTLGELLGSDDYGRKIYLLERLVDGDADVRLVDAAVRDFDLCGQTVQGFMSVDFSSLCLSDLVHAAIAVFHPASSPYLVEQCLTIAIERQGDALPPGKVRLWRQIVKAAVLRLHRRAPEVLDEVLDDLLFEQDSSKLTLLRRFVEWAAAKEKAAPRQPERPIDEYLRAVAGEDPDVAERAAVELMVIGGFVYMSAELD